MNEYKNVKKTVKEKQVVAIICDCCKKKIKITDIEIQEMLRWENWCGYGSIFGDGNKIKIDLCQECVKNLLGNYIQKYGNME